MSLVSKLLKKTTIAETALLKESNLWKPKDMIVTDVPALNVALSGRLNGGMGPGILQIAGQSKRFKSKFALLLTDTFQRKFGEGAVLFYDSEAGTPNSYFDQMNTDSIVHSPIINLEQLTHDIAVQLEEITSSDRLFILIDSLGNTPSIKEATDALKKSEIPQDMTRAKAIKSLFRIVGPQINVKNIYLVVINHTYKTLELYAKEVASGGSGIEFNSNGIWIIGAEKVKDASGKELEGFNFNIKIEKSRFVKQDKKIPVSVTFEAGIDPWSGLLEMALEGKFVLRPTLQKYVFAHDPKEEYKLKEIEGNNKFFEKLLKETQFPSWVEKEYVL